MRDKVVPIEPYAEIHLDPLHRHPLAVHAYLGRQVGRHVEVVRKHTVRQGLLPLAVRFLLDRRAVRLDRRDDLRQPLGGLRVDDDARVGGFLTGFSDPDVGEFERPAVLEDAVQDLGQQQGVDDVTVEEDRLVRHARHLHASIIPRFYSRRAPPPNVSASGLINGSSAIRSRCEIGSTLRVSRNVPSRLSETTSRQTPEMKKTNGRLETKPRCHPSRSSSEGTTAASQLPSIAPRNQPRAFTAFHTATPFARSSGRTASNT